MQILLLNSGYECKSRFITISIWVVVVEVVVVAAVAVVVSVWVEEGLLHIRISGWASDSNLHLLSLIIGICTY